MSIPGTRDFHHGLLRTLTGMNVPFWPPMHPAPLVVGAGLVVLTFGAAAQQPPASASVPELLQRFVPVTDAMLQQPAPENWISFRNGYGLWGYSALTQINADTVDELRLVWSRAMQHGYQEGSSHKCMHDSGMISPITRRPKDEE